MIGYEVIASGSKGNAVVINGRTLIDCGVPFKALESVYRGLSLVLLTHAHTDHFNRATIRRLARERPTLRWGCPQYLAADLIDCEVKPRSVDIYHMNGGANKYIYAGLAVEPFALIHDVPNVGYKICDGGGRLFYATDTNTLDGIEAKGYDLYMVEANYGEAEIAERIRRKQDAGEYVHEWDVLENHLSEEKALDFIYRNIGADGRYVLMHQHEETGGAPGPDGS